MRRLRFLVERVLLLESDKLSLSRKLDRTAVMIEMHVVGGCRCFFLARPFRIRFIRNMTLGWRKVSMKFVIDVKLAFGWQ